MKEHTIEFIKALVALLMLQSYTRFERWVEISFGILAWINIGIIIWALI